MATKWFVVAANTIGCGGPYFEAWDPHYPPPKAWLYGPFKSGFGGTL